MQDISEFSHQDRSMDVFYLGVYSQRLLRKGERKSYTYSRLLHLQESGEFTFSEDKQEKNLEDSGFSKPTFFTGTFKFVNTSLCLLFNNSNPIKSLIASVSFINLSSGKKACSIDDMPWLLHQPEEATKLGLPTNTTPVYPLLEETSWTVAQFFFSWEQVRVILAGFSDPSFAFFLPFDIISSVLGLFQLNLPTPFKPGMIIDFEGVKREHFEVRDTPKLQPKIREKYHVTEDILCSSIFYEPLNVRQFSKTSLGLFGKEPMTFILLEFKQKINSDLFPHSMICTGKWKKAEHSQFLSIRRTSNLFYLHIHGFWQRAEVLSHNSLRTESSDGLHTWTFLSDDVIVETTGEKRYLFYSSFDNWIKKKIKDK